MFQTVALALALAGGLFGSLFGLQTPEKEAARPMIHEDYITASDEIQRNLTSGADVPRRTEIGATSKILTLDEVYTDVTARNNKNAAAVDGDGRGVMTTLGE